MGDFAAGFFGVAFLAAGFRAAGFAAVFFFAGDLAFAAGFLAAGLRLAAAMADVSPVPSEGARALAVDSRVAAPQNDATAGRTRARARPRERCRAQAARRTGLATAQWCADAAK